MIRHKLPFAPLAPAFGFLVAALAVAAPAGGAAAQDRSTQDRLDRLERDLSMLQRQVYRGGAPAPMGGDSTMAVGAELRLDRMETQMRDLTGRVEEYANRVEQLRQRLEQINSDIETRFSQGAGAAMASAVPSSPPPPPPPRSRSGASASSQPIPLDAPASSAGTLTPPTSLMPAGTVVPPPSGVSPVFGTLSPPGSPSSVPELPNAGPAPLHPPGGAGAAAGEGSPAQQYNHAFGLLKQADYPAAEQALRAFVQQHPDDPMAGNAQYWIGETLYARGKYGEAASAFAEAYKRYPKNAKAPENLLKLSMSLARANQKQNACIALAQLDRDFPTPSATVRERAAAEKRRLGC
ncbi:MAG: tol-pal system protein YbgF [Alphaproteobacteria bacterium]|nr:tol-pal system protein YbgF [Alphaproteobacteria bacterium]